VQLSSKNKRIVVHLAKRLLAFQELGQRCQSILLLAQFLLCKSQEQRDLPNQTRRLFQHKYLVKVVYCIFVFLLSHAYQPLEIVDIFHFWKG
jgi:hypothetical protein